MAHQIRSNKSGKFSKVVSKNGINVLIPIAPSAPPSIVNSSQQLFYVRRNRTSRPNSNDSTTTNETVDSSSSNESQRSDYSEFGYDFIHGANNISYEEIDLSTKLIVF